MALTAEELSQIERHLLATPDIIKAPKKKPRMHWESNLVADYAAEHYPNALRWRRVQVGAIPAGKDPKMYGHLRRWADLVVYDGKEVIIIEAKMKPAPGAISQLLLYMQLFPKTPEFSLYKQKPLRGVVLTTMEDIEVRSLAEAQGLDYEIYSPSWVRNYWDIQLGNSASTKPRTQ